MTQQLCPERTVLAAFGRGELTEERFEQIAPHIVDCSTCQQVLAQLGEGSDALLAGLRQVRGKDGAEPRPDTYSTQHSSSADTAAVRTPPGYELLDEVGRGGMGMVHRARDTRLNREVAIKLLRDDCRADAAVSARFVAEAQITGQLQHPGIPAVHELGQLPDGKPFLAMKLVKGHTLHQLLHERRDAAQERGRYLAIFEQICQAVGYAHAHRVIHRDLKPGNVMVGAFGEVQVMDWGLAKLLAAEDKKQVQTEGELAETQLAVTAIETPQQVGSATRTGSVMGTPAYMASEQAGGEIRKLDARSDVFGLGAILCEILTGLPPYQGKDVQAIRLQAVRGELTETLTRLEACGAGPEVVALCKRCLAFKQEDRPSHGGAVAAEVASIRQAAEERARRAELERAEALVREAEQRKRRRVWLGLAACLLLGLLTSSGLGLWANYARQQAETAQAAEASAKEQTQKRLKQIETSNDILTSIFTDLDIREIKKGREPLEAVLAKRLVKAAELLEGEAVGDPLMVAAIQNRLGRTLLNLGYAEEAITSVDKARITFTDKLGMDHLDTLNCMANLADIYRAAGQYAEALSLREKTLQGVKAQSGADHLHTLSCMSGLALSYLDVGQLDKGLSLFEETLPRMQTKLGADHPETLTCMNNLAAAYKAAGQLDKAQLRYEETLRLRKTKQGADHPDTLISMGSLALIYQDTGRLDKAISLLVETLRRMKAKLGDDHPDTLTSMGNLATCYLHTRQVAKALPLLEETLQHQKAKLGIDHLDTLQSMNNLAGGYLEAGQLDKAVPLYEETLRRRKVKLGDYHPETLESMGNLAEGYRVAGQFNKALPLFEQTRKLALAKLGPDHRYTLVCTNNLALVYYRVGQLDKALPLFEETLQQGKDKLGADHPETLVTMYNLAHAYCKAERGDKAVRLFAEYFQSQRKQTKPNDPFVAGQLANAAQKLLACGRFKESESYLRECLAIRQKTQPDAWNTFNTVSMLGAALLGQKKYAEAEPLLLQGYEGMKVRAKSIPPPGKVRLTEALERLIQLYTALDRSDQAARWRAELARRTGSDIQSKD